MKKIKYAVIGAGYLGRFHAQKVCNSQNAELVAIVDVEHNKARQLANSLNPEIKAFNSLDDLKALDIKAASVVSSTNSHFEVADELLDQGIDLLIEKPITSVILEARRLIKKAQDNNLIIQVGHLERFNPAFLKLEELITTPVYFEAKRISPFSGRGVDVDVVKDLMIHDVDLVCHLVAKNLVRVEASGIPVVTEGVDMASARLVFEGGVTANLVSSRVAFKTERSLRVFQPDFYFNLDFNAKLLRVHKRELENDSRFKIDVTEYKSQSDDVLQAEIESFLDSVRHRAEPKVKAEDGLRALEISELIENSISHSIEALGPIFKNWAPLYPREVNA